jgi:glycine/D-amino acid oxidase-like deaminating enzyme
VNERPLRADVVVVGGGLTGTATALMLADGGADVVVVEARSPSTTTTARSTGKLTVMQGTRLARVARHGDEVLASFVAAGLAGLDWLRRALGDTIEDRDDLTVAGTPEDASSLEGVLEACTRTGLVARWEDDPPLPAPAFAAVRLEGQAQMDPSAALSALRERLTGRGVRVHDGALVRQVRRVSSGVELRTSRGTVRAGHVVLATGVPPGRYGGLVLRLEAQRSYLTSWRLAPDASLPDGFERTMSITAGEPTRSVRVSGDLLVVGGEGHVVGREPDTPARVAALDAWTRQHFPVEARLDAWAAQDYATDTDVPFVGPALPRDDRVLVATGYAKWGLVNAAAAGIALSGRLLGEPVDWASALEPWARPPRARASTARTLGNQVAGWSRAVSRPRGSAPGDEGATVSRVCPHLGGVVCWNEFERSWDCPVHGSRFAPDGARLEGPTTADLSPARPATSKT